MAGASNPSETARTKLEPQTETPKWNGFDTNVINNTCAFPAMACPNVFSKKVCNETLAAAKAHWLYA